MNFTPDQRIPAELSEAQRTIDTSEPGSISWEERNRILELVETLPPDQERRWKAANLAKLNLAARGPDESVSDDDP